MSRSNTPNTILSTYNIDQSTTLSTNTNNGKSFSTGRTLPSTDVIPLTEPDSRSQQQFANLEARQQQINRAVSDDHFTRQAPHQHEFSSQQNNKIRQTQSQHQQLNQYSTYIPEQEQVPITHNANAQSQKSMNGNILGIPIEKNNNPPNALRQAEQLVKEIEQQHQQQQLQYDEPQPTDSEILQYDAEPQYDTSTDISAAVPEVTYPPQPLPRQSYPQQQQQEQVAYDPSIYHHPPIPPDSTASSRQSRPMTPSSLTFDLCMKPSRSTTTIQSGSVLNTEL